MVVELSGLGILITILLLIVRIMAAFVLCVGRALGETRGREPCSERNLDLAATEASFYSSVHHSTV